MHFMTQGHKHIVCLFDVPDKAILHQEEKLEEEQLLKGKPSRCTFQFMSSGGLMHLHHRLQSISKTKSQVGH